MAQPLPDMPGDVSTARGIVAAITEAVRSGLLSGGDRLPPVRVVARQFGVSPTTVSAAWSQLLRAGVIRTDGRRGTTISAPIKTARRDVQATSRVEDLSIDLSIGGPDPRLLPDVGAALRSMTGDFAVPSFQDKPILPELETLLRAQWPYDAESMTIVDGAIDGLDLVTRVAAVEGSRVVVETPCFPLLLDMLENSRAVDVISTDLDDEGIRLDGVSRAFEEPVAAIFIQPLAQNPTGISMSPARARALATIIEQSNALVVEDASCTPVSTHEPLSLGQWLPDRTVHIYSFSKSHGPELRLAAVSGPDVIIEQINALRRRGQGWTSRILQQLLVTMLSDRSCQQAVTNAVVAYQKRRSALVEDLAARGISVRSTDGYNVWLPVVNETTAVMHAAHHGLGVAPGSPFLATVEQPHLRITTSCLDEADAGRVADILVQAARSSPWIRA